MEQEIPVFNVWHTAKHNRNYVSTVATTRQLQVVVQSIEPEDRGVPPEVHRTSTQEITVVKGHGVVDIGGQSFELRRGMSLIVPAGTRHAIVNTSSRKRLVLFSVYAPPIHPPDYVVERRQDE